MKKADQLEMNRLVDEVYEDVIKSLDNYGMQYQGKLRSCSADVWRTYGYYVLRSYTTIIACVDNEGVCYDFLRKVYGYTATSALHIAKFRNDYAYSGKCFTWRDI